MRWPWHNNFITPWIGICFFGKAYAPKRLWRYPANTNVMSPRRPHIVDPSKPSPLLTSTSPSTQRMIARSAQRNGGVVIKEKTARQKILSLCVPQSHPRAANNNARFFKLDLGRSVGEEEGRDEKQQQRFELFF